MPGPPKRPSALDALLNHPGHRPVNRREPKPTPTTDTLPTGLPFTAAAIWRDLAPELVRLELLTVLDRRALATACRLQALGDAYAAKAEGALADDKIPHALWAAAKCWEKAQMIFSRFGVTPSDRTRLTTGGSSDAHDDFESFRRKKPTTRPAA